MQRRKTHAAQAIETPSNLNPYFLKIRPQGSLWNLILFIEFCSYALGSFIDILKYSTAKGKTAPKPKVRRQTHSRRSSVKICKRIYGTKLKSSLSTWMRIVDHSQKALAHFATTKPRSIIVFVDRMTSFC